MGLFKKYKINGFVILSEEKDPGELKFNIITSN
jgi:hypothetical protein